MDNSIFDELKVRASYGITGNQNILSPAYGGNPLYLAANNVRDLNNTGVGYDNLPSIFVENIGNKTLRWEETAQGDIGVDFVIKKRLSGTIDLYKKTTSQLFDNKLTSGVVGSYSIPGNTDAKLVNTGVELLLRYDVFKGKDFKLNVFVNGSYNKNEYADLKYSEGEERVRIADDYANQNGHQLAEYFVVPYAGVNPVNGNLLFYDINNNLTENPVDEDRRMTGKSAVPVYQGGFGFDSSYKGFFLSTQFSFAAKLDRFDYDLLNYSRPDGIGSYAVSGDLIYAWTPTNTSSSVPSLTANNLDAGDNFSDRWLRDASYLRLKSLTLGYDVPSKYVQKTFISSFRIYSQLENYFTWTKWQGFDVDGLNSSNQGGFPSPKVISVGLDLQF
jgi:hypothetical protein